MILEADGLIYRKKDNCVLLAVPLENTSFIDKQNITEARVIFHDGRSISALQRKKTYATIRDISEFTGDSPEYMKEFLKYSFIERYGGRYFSLSNCTVELAREFISYLIDFCFEQNIPTRDTLLNRTDDISQYLYSCLAHRRCAVCNFKGEVHHISGDRVGMGFDRNRIDNIGRRAICLCRKHHNQAHNDEKAFFEKYRIYGIPLDEYLVRKLKI